MALRRLYQMNWLRLWPKESLGYRWASTFEDEAPKGPAQKGPEQAGIELQAKLDKYRRPKGFEKTNQKPWISYGFHFYDQDKDRHYMHCSLFMSISVLIGSLVYIFSYFPDMFLENWKRREAYIQLRYREEHGLPLIDPNFIDPAQIYLPTDEELGETDVII